MSEDLEELRYHWGSAYRINGPVDRDGCWQAVALFGSKNVLEADSAWELREKISRHYPGLTEETKKLGR